MVGEILKNIEMLPDEVEFVSDLKAIVYTAKTKAYQAVDLYNVVILRIPCAELELAQILPANLYWSHYECLMQIADEDERDWYMREAALEEHRAFSA